MAIKLSLSSCLVVVTMIGSATLSKAAEIVANSCSAADVRAAYAATAANDTVVLPACPSGEVWNTTTSGSAEVQISKNITIRGQGAHLTHIIDATGGALNEVPFLIRDSDLTVKIMGIRFSGTAGGPNILSRSDPQNNEITVAYCWFDGQSPAVSLQASYATSKAFVYANLFTDFGTATFFAGNRDADWLVGHTLGSDEGFMVEDNRFAAAATNDNALSPSSGGRGTARYNRWESTQIDLHGACSAPRGAMSLEFYGNFMTDQPHGKSNPLALRGGSHTVYDNILDGFGPNRMALRNFRTCAGITTPCATRCDGTDPRDGNTPGGMGWPCLDQIGRSAGPIGNQSSVPSYFWDNFEPDGVTPIPPNVYSNCAFHETIFPLRILKR